MDLLSCIIFILMFNFLSYLFIVIWGWNNNTKMNRDAEREKDDSLTVFYLIPE